MGKLAVFSARLIFLFILSRISLRVNAFFGKKRAFATFLPFEQTNAPAVVKVFDASGILSGELGVNFL